MRGGDWEGGRLGGGETGRGRLGGRETGSRTTCNFVVHTEKNIPLPPPTPDPSVCDLWDNVCAGNSESLSSASHPQGDSMAVLQ